MPQTKLQADQVNVSSSGGGYDPATTGDVLRITNDFLSSGIPSEWKASNSGTGSGFSYSNTYVASLRGFVFPGPGTDATANTGRATISPVIAIGDTTGFSVADGAIDVTFIVQTPSIAASVTEDYFELYGFNNLYFNPNTDNGARIYRVYNENSGNYKFVYRTTTDQVVINGSLGAATDTKFVLRFRISGPNHDCEFWINGVSQGTGTPGTKITATNNTALWMHVAKRASAGGHPRPRWDYIDFYQEINRN